MGRDRREVGHEIHVLSNMIGRKIDEEKRQRNMGDVSPVQTWVIRYLHDHKGQEICQRDLERDFNVTRSTVTGILQIMEKIHDLDLGMCIQGRDSFVKKNDLWLACYSTGNADTLQLSAGQFMGISVCIGGIQSHKL